MKIRLHSLQRKSFGKDHYVYLFLGFGTGAVENCGKELQVQIVLFVLLDSYPTYEVSDILCF
jgi:hypothetical protein